MVNPARTQIAHKLSYFVNRRETNGRIKGRSAELDFVFLIYHERYKEATGITKMEDLNHVIRATCDTIRQLTGAGDSFIKRGLTPIFFGIGDRPCGTPFAFSSLVDLAPRPRFPTRVTKWFFVMDPKLGQEITWVPGRLQEVDLWFYGFVRFNEGEVEILHLEEFVSTLQAERPDLPPVAGFGKSTEGEGDGRPATFYEELRSMLGAAPQSETWRVPCKLITRERAKTVIESFITSYI